jgi:acyl-CoA thioesterase I
MLQLTGAKLIPALRTSRAVELRDLPIERGDRLLEHRAVGGRRGALEVGRGAGASELQRRAPGAPRLFLGAQVFALLASPRRFLLLELDHLRLEPSRHRHLTPTYNEYSMPGSRATSIRIFVLACLLLAGCSRGAPEAQQQAPAQNPPQAAAPANPDDSGRPKVVVLGDSLTAGYGLLESQAFPALLQQKLDAEGYGWEVVNAGISGDTSAAGLQRIDWALGQGDVRILILELGANDGLRGLPISEMRKNLAGIIERAQEKQIAVLLAGMEAPPNFGPEYTVSFRQVYRDLAKQYRVTFLPFLLDRVAGDTALNQSDGIHPNIEGTRIVADTVWTLLKPMVDAAE